MNNNNGKQGTQPGTLILLTIAYPTCKHSVAVPLLLLSLVQTTTESQFFELSWKNFLFQIIQRFEKWGVKLQCVTGEGKLDFVQIIGNLKEK